jgi:O-acetyl-ADP-ribose deacetylase (regulator of RNase III)
LGPFLALGKIGPIPLGEAIETVAGKLPFKGIIHVAGISMFWRSSERAIRNSVRNALKIAAERQYRSIAFPIIGSGTGGYNTHEALAIMRSEVENSTYDGEVRIVQFKSGL